MLLLRRIQHADLSDITHGWAQQDAVPIFYQERSFIMGVFSELDLENQQTESEGHDSKAAEMQTLQAKLIKQHEQKKAAAAAETPGKEPAAEPVAKTEAYQDLWQHFMPRANSMP